MKSTFLTYSFSRAFSMIEIMVALVLLAIGLIGLVAMTSLVMSGKDRANHLSNSTDICQLKLEELKDVSFANLGEADLMGAPDDALVWGATNGDIVQEVELNAQGLTRCGYLHRENFVTGSACNGQWFNGCKMVLTNRENVLTSAAITSEDCKTSINEAGPYLYVRSFIVCKGQDYTNVGEEHSRKDSNTIVDGSMGSAEEHCLADESSQTRPSSLTCDKSDIINRGIDSNEKVIKTLCTWRKKSGRCGFVTLSAYRADNL